MENFVSRSIQSNTTRKNSSNTPNKIGNSSDKVKISISSSKSKSKTAVKTTGFNKTSNHFLEQAKPVPNQSSNFNQSAIKNAFSTYRSNSNLKSSASKSPSKKLYYAKSSVAGNNLTKESKTTTIASINGNKIAKSAIKAKPGDSINNIFNNYFNIFNSDIQPNWNIGEKESFTGSKDFTTLKTNYLNSFRASSNQHKSQYTDNQDNFSLESKKETCDKTSCYKYHKRILKEKDEFIKLLLNERTKLKQAVAKLYTELKSTGKNPNININLNELSTLSSPRDKGTGNNTPSKVNKSVGKLPSANSQTRNPLSSSINFNNLKSANFNKNFDFSNDIEYNIESDYNLLISRDNKEKSNYLESKDYKGTNLSLVISKYGGGSGEETNRDHNGLNSEAMDINELNVNYDEIENNESINHKLDDLKTRMIEVLQNYSLRIQNL